MKWRIHLLCINRTNYWFLFDGRIQLTAKVTDWADTMLRTYSSHSQTRTSPVLMSCMTGMSDTSADFILLSCAFLHSLVVGFWGWKTYPPNPMKKKVRSPLENEAVTNPLFVLVYRRRLPGAIETSYLLPRSIYHTQLVLWLSLNQQRAVIHFRK
jgi:hypothetical protein